jgi:hypothetical protein
MLKERVADRAPHASKQYYYYRYDYFQIANGTYENVFDMDDVSLFQILFYSLFNNNNLGLILSQQIAQKEE